MSEARSYVYESGKALAPRLMQRHDPAMRMIHAVVPRRVHTTAALLLVACLPALGCGVRVLPARKGIPSTKLSAPKAMAVGEVYEHKGTGIEFPKEAANWKRTGADRYDEEENDIGVSFGRGGRGDRTVLTIYLFPAPHLGKRRPASLRRHMDAEREALAEALGQPKPLTEHKNAEGEIEALEFESSVYGPRPMREILVLHPRGAWRLKYRLSTPATKRTQAVRALRALLRELDLPTVALGAM